MCGRVSWLWVFCGFSYYFILYNKCRFEVSKSLVFVRLRFKKLGKGLGLRKDFEFCFG